MAAKGEVEAKDTNNKVHSRKWSSKGCWTLSGLLKREITESTTRRLKSDNFLKMKERTKAVNPYNEGKVPAAILLGTWPMMMSLQVTANAYESPASASPR